MKLKKIIAFVAFILLTVTARGQVNIGKLVDSLKYMQTDTLDCSAEIFWKIVAQREKAVPFLIEKLTDLTPTRIKDRCKTTPLNVSEVAYYAFRQIADLPLFRVTEIQFDYFDGKGCNGFHNWYFFSDSLAHKQDFQDKIRKCWLTNFSTYRWVKISKNNLSSCQILAGIKGYYKFVGL